MATIEITFRETAKHIDTLIAPLKDGDTPENTAQESAADHVGNALAVHVRGVSLGSQDGVLVAVDPDSDAGEYEVGRYDYVLVSHA